MVSSSPCGVMSLKGSRSGVARDSEIELSGTAADRLIFGEAANPLFSPPNVLEGAWARSGFLAGIFSCRRDGEPNGLVEAST